MTYMGGHTNVAIVQILSENILMYNTIENTHRREAIPMQTLWPGFFFRAGD